MRGDMNSIFQFFLHRHGVALWWGFIVFFAVLMTLKFFPGLENEDAYGGLSYQAIHPGALMGDLYYSPDIPALEAQYRLSVYYQLPKLFGEIWLDDRFIAGFYLLVVIAGMVAVDRIARLLGASSLAQRAIVMILALKDNDMLNNKVLLSHHPDFNHSAFSIPISLWLYYLALSRKGLMPVLILSGLLAAFSVKNAALPVATSLMIVGVTAATLWERRAAWALIAVFSLVAVFGLFSIFAPPEADRLELWDHLVEEFVRPGNIFNAIHFGWTKELSLYTVFLALCVATLVWPVQVTPAIKGVRIVVTVTLISWVLNGLYVAYAPPDLRMPAILPFSLNSRALQFPQILAYIALATIAVRWADETMDNRRICLVLVTLVVMFLVAPANLGIWAAVLTVSAMVVLTGFALLGNLRKNWIAATGLALSMALVISLVGTVAAKKIPAWKLLMETGVFGDSTTAHWVEVAPWIRDNTPFDAQILAYIYTPDGELEAIRSLATRTGRPQTKGHRGTRQFDAPTWRLNKRQDHLLSKAGEAWLAGDAQNLVRAINGLIIPPHYLILPMQAFAKMDINQVPFFLAVEKGGYAILQRIP
jgi:hypothetical protein